VREACHITGTSAAGTVQHITVLAKQGARWCTHECAVAVLQSRTADPLRHTQSSAKQHPGLLEAKDFTTSGFMSHHDDDMHQHCSQHLSVEQAEPWHH
jgi:hypothetical protein